MTVPAAAEGAGSKRLVTSQQTDATVAALPNVMVSNVLLFLSRTLTVRTVT
jgi:hypothetical protein